MPHEAHPDRWIETLAEPYLRAYLAVPETKGNLRGYRFFARGPAGSRTRCGFFVGYLLRDTRFEFLQPHCPECIVFAFVEPAVGATRRRLVAADGSLLRRTWEYIRWLTHRAPRFVFFEDRNEVLVRHFSMRGWPEKKYEHYSRNFFIETLAWLVRSGLVKQFRAETSERAGRPKLRRAG